MFAIEDAKAKSERETFFHELASEQADFQRQLAQETEKRLQERNKREDTFTQSWTIITGQLANEKLRTDGIK